MNNVWVLPYKQGSKSARELSNKLGVKQVRRTRSRWRTRRGRRLINWGTSQSNIPEHCLGHDNWINYPADISRANNKLLCLSTLEEAGVPVVPWTTDQTQAISWLDGGFKVYARTQLSGHSGAGIVVASSRQELVDAPLYTKRLNARYEYRVHVAFGKVIDVSRKAKREGVEGNPLVRNHANGYVYRREGIDKPQALLDAGVKAVGAIPLDFGAVDILWYRDEPYVLEVNTAPGLEGTTVENYAEAFEEEL